jgi:DNA-binding NtrC family response regulator
MADNISAIVLLHGPSGLWQSLKHVLRGQTVRTHQARTCRELAQLLSGPDQPALIFTEAELADGNWQDVVRLAEAASRPVNVIVVSRQVDIRLYVEALQSGAFDFITPPFEPPEVAHVLRCAVGNVAARRNVTVRADPSHKRGAGQLSLPLAS